MADDKTITFRVWFAVSLDGTVEMLDSAAAAMNGSEDEEWFGPYEIAIPTPERILLKLLELGQVIEGTVNDG